MHDVPPNFGKQQGPDSVLAYTSISIKVRNNDTKGSEFVCDLVYTDLISLMYSRISLFILLSFPKLLKYFQKYINFIAFLNAIIDLNEILRNKYVINSTLGRCLYLKRGKNFPWGKTGMASEEPRHHPVAVAQA